jgi:hypothetical protein
MAKKKHRKDVTNKYKTFETNPIVQPDGETEMNVPVPSDENVKNSKDFGEEHEM